MIYLISDTHLHHKNIIDYDNREDNYIDIIKNDFKILNQSDTLIHLGDVFFSRATESMQIFKNINCHKILIKGNHDNKEDDWYLEHGFDEVYEKFSLIINDKNILFTHIPQKINNTIYDINIHGHLHNDSQHNLDYLGEKHKLVFYRLKTINEIIGV